MTRKEEYARLCLCLRAYAKPGQRIIDGGIIQDADLLSRYAAQAMRHAVNLCNVPDWQAKYDKAMPKIRERATKVLERYRLEVSLGGDPRGSVFRLIGKGCEHCL